MFEQIFDQKTKISKNTEFFQTRQKILSTKSKKCLKFKRDFYTTLLDALYSKFQTIWGNWNIQRSNSPYRVIGALHKKNLIVH